MFGKIKYCKGVSLATETNKFQTVWVNKPFNIIAEQYSDWLQQGNTWTIELLKLLDEILIIFSRVKLSYTNIQDQQKDILF